MPKQVTQELQQFLTRGILTHGFTLLHSASRGASTAGPAQKRAPVRMPLAAVPGPEPKGLLFAQIDAFNLHAAGRAAPNDKQGKESESPFAGDRGRGSGQAGGR